MFLAFTAGEMLQALFEHILYIFHRSAKFIYTCSLFTLDSSQYTQYAPLSDAANKVTHSRIRLDMVTMMIGYNVIENYSIHLNTLIKISK